MNAHHASFYDPEYFDDAPGFIDAAAERRQRIAELAREYAADALQGKGDFWPGAVRCDGAIEGPAWDLDQGNTLLAALRDSLASTDPAGAQLKYAKAISDAITDYAQRRAQAEVD